MNNFKSHFAFNRSQRNGIFLLVFIIVVLQLLWFLDPFASEEPVNAKEQQVVEKLQHQIDSLKQIAVKKDSISFQPFNPNFISDYKGYLLGMSVEEIDRLHSYREKELWVNSAEEFRQVTGVSDSLLKKISPYFKFPEFASVSPKKNNTQKGHFSVVSKNDINSATSEDLRKINGIGEKLSARIINYRQSLGGFRGMIQVHDVYGLSPEVIGRVEERFDVKNSLPRLNINTATVIELSELPYFNYELAREVISFRKNRDSITSFEELRQIKGFPVEKLDRIKLYLAID
ncbi:ComEA family DNA-binding protein [Salinimicrobium soli]|uniref:ComEA family DNA-binding protein n=1 Tax=Salinimicrobium soli TaxID=1254399 RepID=UPI003AB0A401